MQRTDVLKLYHARPAGGDSAYWEDEWAQHNPYSSFAQMQDDPLTPILRRYLSRTHDNLEGGCGPAHWVRYWQAQGYPMVGLDFATRTLARARVADPELRLVNGDVNQLPFPDGVFGSYYSGGVVEHFEAGPERAVREARRVLRDDGTLLISVPDLTPLRRWRYPAEADGLKRGFSWRWVTNTAVDEPPEPGETFYQYVYPEVRFRSLLKAAGFRVLETHGVFILHGLLFEGMLPRFLRGAPDHPAPATRVASERAGPTRTGGMLKTLAKRLLVHEDASGLLAPLAPLLGCCRCLFANMRLYVCRSSRG